MEPAVPDDTRALPMDDKRTDDGTGAVHDTPRHALLGYEYSLVVPSPSPSSSCSARYYPLSSRVVLLRPLSPVTRPPEDMEKLYWPSSWRLMVMGRRLEMSNSRPDALGSLVGIVGGGGWCCDSRRQRELVVAWAWR